VYFTSSDVRSCKNAKGWSHANTLQIEVQQTVSRLWWLNIKWKFV